MGPILLGELHHFQVSHYSSTRASFPGSADAHMSLKGRIHSWHLGSKMWAFVPRVIIINKSKCREMLSLYNKRKFILVHLNKLSQHPQL